MIQTLIAGSGGRVNHESFNDFLIMCSFLFLLPTVVVLTGKVIYNKLTEVK
jgi:hypothetical protein